MESEEAGRSIVANGAVYRVAIIKDLGGPMSVVLDGVVYVHDSGDHDTNIEHARMIAESL